MLRIIAAIAAATIATASHAEEWEFSTHGSWNVKLVELDQGLTCRVGVFSTEEGLGLHLWHNISGIPITLQFFDAHFNYGHQSGSFNIMIDDGPVVSLAGSSFENSLFAPGITPNFLEDISTGRGIYIDDDKDGKDVVWISLDGSAAAIASFRDCISKLGEDAA